MLCKEEKKIRYYKLLRIISQYHNTIKLISKGLGNIISHILAEDIVSELKNKCKRDQVCMQEEKLKGQIVEKKKLRENRTYSITCIRYIKIR